MQSMSDKGEQEKLLQSMSNYETIQFETYPNFTNISNYVIEIKNTFTTTNSTDDQAMKLVRKKLDELIPATVSYKSDEYYKLGSIALVWFLFGILGFSVDLYRYFYSLDVYIYILIM